MKITCVYYLSYPDSPPPDPLVAASEVYVEVSEGDGNIDAFDFTYAIHVYTTGFIRRQVEENSFFLSGPAIVVDRFDNASINHALDAILPKIDEIAERK